MHHPRSRPVFALPEGVEHRSEWASRSHGKGKAWVAYPGTTGALGDLVGGRIKVEVWDAIGAGSSTVGTGATSLIRIPFGQ